MSRLRFKILGAAVSLLLSALPAWGWPGMEMPVLHVDGRYLKDADGNVVNLHGFAQTYSPWFNEYGTKWNNYDVEKCLSYNKGKIDGMLAAGWKMNFIRLHMDPYWSNTPGVSTTGEDDISAFSFDRFKTYLDKVFIPMAEYAVSQGLYVVMRPPGVCPKKIEIGDSYHEYLKKVWGHVASKLKDNSHVMFELANEPVDIKGTDGVYGSYSDACFTNLSAYFQEIVDIIREKGADNILWIPGTGYQSQYAGYANHPIKGDNIGYAVHVYPGWYGSDAIEPSHELGGGYGGGFNAFAAGWERQIIPVADFAPVMVTEMDWAPSVYDSSWGKSITGKMFGDGFGGNFKVLADWSGNVSWLLFTGCEHLSRFEDRFPADGNYTFLTDPEACPWPIYHWFKDYAGEQLPAPSEVSLCCSASVDGAVSDRYVMMTGSLAGIAKVAQYDGYQLCLSDDVSVEIDNPDVAAYDNGIIKALAPGTTRAVVTWTAENGTEKKECELLSSYFPFVTGCFNPSIWEEGTFDPVTRTVKTGQYGFAGWIYALGVDLSSSRYLVAELDGGNQAAVSFRVFDSDNYWSDPAMADFGKNSRVVLDLQNLKSERGRTLDPSHIFIVGFWSLGNAPFKISRVYLSDSPDGDSGVDDTLADSLDALVDVFNLQGIKVRSRVVKSDALSGLEPGIYIVGGKKVAVHF